MAIIKFIHVTCAAISICGFFYRGVLKLYAPKRLQAKWLKITPHIVDTILLASAITLMMQQALYPTTQPWLLTKIIFLALYIAFGLFALRFAKTRTQVLFGLVLAIASFGYIVAAAMTRQAWPLF